MRSMMVLLLFPLWGLCAPPEVKFPQSEVRVKQGQFVVLKAEVENGKGVTKYRLPQTEDISYLPSNLLADPSTVVFVPLVKDAKFVVWAWSGNEDGASELAEVTVVVGDGGSQNPPPVDDPDDPPAQAGKFYFVLVRDDRLPRDDDPVTLSYHLPAWGEIRKDGHQVVERTRTEVQSILRQSVSEDAAAYKARLDGYVGKVLVFRVSLDGKSSSFQGDKPLPADGAAVKELVK